MRTELTKKEINKLHAVALVINQKYDAAMARRSRTNMERNALKRLQQDVPHTPFTLSMDLTTKSAQIDAALTEFRSLHYLSQYLGFPQNYIQRHINHLLKNFRTTCRMETQERKLRFISLI